MNAESYLRKQGWKGSGHSLDSTGRGIKKPLLISHKQDQLGLGKKKAAYTTDDQWWMRAFDESLQSIGTGKESTLNQVRTKGINRGGLYGFFVKGDEIAGTIDDTSADTTETSTPPSGASTPPTSDSDTEPPAESVKISQPTTKRKRDADDTPATQKKAKNDDAPDVDAKTKKERRVKGTPPDPTKSKHGQLAASPEVQEAVDKKIAKLSPRKKQWYEDRAAAKGQSIEQYLQRRVQKSNKKLGKRNKLKAAEAARSAPAAPPLFITDLEGDAAIAQAAAATAPGQPVLAASPADAAAQAKKEEKRQRRKENKEAKKAKLNDKKVEYKSRTDYQTAMKEKKQRKKAEKAEKHKDGNKTKSKWGDKKDQSRWGKIKAAEEAAAA